MADFYVRWGEDVDPYIVRLASEHIDRLRACCARVLQRIAACRRRAGEVAIITARVDHAMMDEPAHGSFRELGFHFILRESAKQRPGARRREFILNFATRPKFAPEDMPRRLRKRNGKAVVRPAKKAKAGTAKTAKKAKPRPPAAKRPRQVERVLSFLHKKMAGPGALPSRLTHRLWAMTDTQRIRELWACAVTMWRRRPRLSFRVKALLTSLSEIPAHAPVRAWLERRAYGEAIGLPILLSTIVWADPPIDWDSFPFGPPEESERLPA